MNKDEYKKLKDKLCSRDSRYDETKLIEKLMLENLQKRGVQNGLSTRKCPSSSSSKSLW